MESIGIIGSGNMGGAIAHGLIKNNRDLIISDKNLKALEEYKNLENVKVELDSNDLVKNSKYIILAVKPNIYKSVIDEIKNSFSEDKILISIAAGFTIEKLENLLPNRKIAMVMPNTPAMVFEAMSAICPNSLLTEEEILNVKSIFDLIGKTSILEENYFTAFAAACGCLPAYVYMLIEAVADGAVLNGLKRDDAYKFISQTVLGSAKMVLETKKHPGELKDMVTSPGGTTIEGVKVLEDRAFRGAIIEAINATVEKSNNM